MARQRGVRAGERVDRIGAGHDAELVAAHPVGAVDRFGERRREPFEQGVPGRVAEGVVVVLEAVEVEQVSDMGVWGGRRTASFRSRSARGGCRAMSGRRSWPLSGCGQQPLVLDQTGGLTHEHDQHARRREPDRQRAVGRQLAVQEHPTDAPANAVGSAIERRSGGAGAGEAGGRRRPSPAASRTACSPERSRRSGRATDGRSAWTSIVSHTPNARIPSISGSQWANRQPSSKGRADEEADDEHVEERVDAPQHRGQRAPGAPRSGVMSTNSAAAARHRATRRPPGPGPTRAAVRTRRGERAVEERVPSQPQDVTEKASWGAATGRSAFRARADAGQDEAGGEQQVGARGRSGATPRATAMAARTTRRRSDSPGTAAARAGPAACAATMRATARRGADRHTGRVGEVAGNAKPFFGERERATPQMYVDGWTGDT